MSPALAATTYLPASIEEDSILGALGNLSSQVTNFQRVIDELEARLAPVLRAGMPVEAYTPAANSLANSGLRDSILEIQDRLIRAQMHVGHIFQRLDLPA